MVEVLGVVDMANIGAPVRLSFHATPLLDPNQLGAVCPDPSTLHDKDARASLELACQYTAGVLGLPKSCDVSWTLASPDDLHLPIVQGPSLFGAFCMGLLQLTACETPGAVREWSRGLVDTIRDTPLQHVAVSAAFDPAWGSFTSVGKMRSKLKGLARLGEDRCAVCVVAKGQDIEGERGEVIDAETGCFSMTTTLGEIAVVEAADPIEAFRKLFKLQTKRLARCLLQ